MSSPWPPSTKAETSSTEMPSSVARKWRKREVSSTPAMPTTMLRGRPEAFCSAQTMASSGLVMTMTKAVGGVFLDAGADLLHHLDVDADEVVAAHARLARHAGGDDAHVGALDISISIGAAQLAVEALDRAGLGDIERLALGQALGDVENHDVAQLFQPDQVRKRPADHATANQGDLRARHPVQLPLIYKN